ncbi:Mis12 domain containing protein [Elaphomyces granulatus]
MSDATTSLLTEHFSYTPLSLIDDVINSINNLIYQAISSLESGLLSTPPERLGFAQSSNLTTIPDTDADGNVEYPEARLEIENGLHQLETLFEATVDKAFDKLEIYVLRNILTVPEDLLGWVKLGHYENLSFGDQASNAPTPESINLLRKRLQETRKLHRALKQECARNDTIISQLQSMLSRANTVVMKPTDNESEAPAIQTMPDFSFLTLDPGAKQLRVGENSDIRHTPLTTNATFILSQLPALRATLNYLRPKLSTLPRSADDMDLDSIRDERREYIESRIRMHLERAGEVPMGDGHAVIAGRRIGGAEAQALETVASLLASKERS